MSKPKIVTKKPSSSRALILALIAVVAIAFGARLAVWNGGSHSDVGAIGGPFVLTDQDGAQVTDKSWPDKLKLIYFGYTFCPDVCPTTLGTMAQALDLLSPAERAALQPVFITVDPERDTQAAMKDYVAAFMPDLVGLRGDADQTQTAMKAYKVYAAKVKSDDPTAYTVDHSSIIYLMGKDGAFLHYFAHGTTAADIAAGLRKYLQ